MEKAIRRFARIKILIYALYSIHQPFHILVSVINIFTLLLGCGSNLAIRFPLLSFSCAGKLIQWDGYMSSCGRGESPLSGLWLTSVGFTDSVAFGCAG